MVKNFHSLRGRPGGSPVVGKSPMRSRRRSGAGGKSTSSAGAMAINRTGSSSTRTGSASSAPPPVAANINVAVRVRPENEREQAGNYDKVVEVIDKSMLVFDRQGDGDDVFFFKGKRQGMRDLNKKAKKDKTFTFDNVYGPDSTNEEVFESTTKNVVSTLLEGYNCCVFAYGATGAGKTFTMLGSKEKPGIISLTMSEVFNRVEQLNEETTFEIFMSYLEVYNETIRDLLDTNKVLNVREDTKNGTSIPGLSVHKPRGPDEVLKLLKYGNSNRSQHPTDHNKESSRSHAVMQIIVQQKAKDSGLSAEVKTAKLSMIDLAGSEKGTATGHKGARFREGANINKSLLALGNCINALASGAKYIPYRDSKLTRLLKDSIGGNCATVMIANVSPSSLTYEDTLNTLKYADRAKKIKIDLKKNVVSVDFHIGQYAKIVEDLRTEIVTLKEKIKSLEDENVTLKEDGGGGRMEVVGEDVLLSTNEGEDDLSQVSILKAQLSQLIQRQQDYDMLQARLAEFERLETENQNLKARLESAVKRAAGPVHPGGAQHWEDAEFNSLLDLRRHLVESIGNTQSLISSLTLRLHFKEQLTDRANAVCLVELQKEKTVMKTRNATEFLRKKIDKKKERINDLISKLESLNTKINEHLMNNPHPHSHRLMSLHSALDEHKAENSMLHEVIHCMEQELNRVHSELSSALPLLTRNEKIVRGHGMQSKEDTAKFSELQEQIQGNKQITFEAGLKDSASKGAVISVYKQVSRLNLPNLQLTTRSTSVEQRGLFGAADNTFASMEDSEMDSYCKSINSPAKQLNFNKDFEEIEHDGATDISMKQNLMNPLNPQTKEAKNSQAYAGENGSNIAETSGGKDLTTSDERRHCTEQIEIPSFKSSNIPEPSLDDTSEIMPATPVVPLVKPAAARRVGTYILPATPQITQTGGQTRRSLSRGNSTTDTSFIDTPTGEAGDEIKQAEAGTKLDFVNNVEPGDLPPAVSDRVTHPDSLNKEEELTGTPTGKRTADRSHEDDQAVETPGKKAKLDGTFDNTSSAAWLSHRSVHNECPETPVAPPKSTELTDQTFTADSPSSSPARQGLNETVTLGVKLDEQCGLGSGAEKENQPAVLPAGGLNSTFPIEQDEPMEVDSTKSVPDMSYIMPRAVKGSNWLRTSPRSPVKAGMFISPRGLAPGITRPTSKRGTPSPLRQSTLIDLKATSAGKDNKWSKEGNAKRTMVKRKLTSMSTSVLPKPGTSSQPISFRSTIQRVNPSAGKDAAESRPGNNYMSATTASKLKTGSDAKLKVGAAGGSKLKRSTSFKNPNKL